MYYHNLTSTTIVTCSPHNVQWPAFTSLVANFAFKTTTLRCDNRRETHQWNLLQRTSPDGSWGQGHWEEALGVGVWYGGYTSLVCGTTAIPSSTMSCVCWVDVCCVCRCAWVEGCGWRGVGVENVRWWICVWGEGMNSEVVVSLWSFQYLTVGVECTMWQIYRRVYRKCSKFASRK